MANYYTQDTIKKFSEALQAARADIRSGKPVKLSISSGNVKMGAVPSVSLLPFITCPGRCTGSCSRECYAAKIANLRKSVLEAYARNTALVMDRPEIFWAGVNAAMAGTRFFRFHVSGDIVNGEYFENLVNACRNNPHCETLVFTKRYEIVNAWMKKNGACRKICTCCFQGGKISNRSTRTSCRKRMFSEKRARAMTGKFAAEIVSNAAAGALAAGKRKTARQSLSKSIDTYIYSTKTRGRVPRIHQEERTKQ